MKKIRCAIYTRKSTDEGLEQDFNSLDAQREACISYITSQKHEGWVLIDDERFEDGGISGGTLERPGLQKLMGRIDEGSIDQIIVYKIDRLTRSLADFAKLVDRLDAANASFVSVTQSFNTSTSMGRLTLNVLLSFAQFEREVTAERIRDKIAASMKKGMWMGGTTPYGYSPKERSLTIIEEEADVIKEIYKLYLTLDSLRSVTEEAIRRGYRTKLRTLKSGKLRGGLRFTKSYIHAVLTNPIYRGQIRHKGKIYPGNHPPVIDKDTFTQVQDKLKSNLQHKQRYGTIKTDSLLKGKIYDETGDRLTPSHGNKNKKKFYRYYVSHRLITSTRQRHKDGWRLPAQALEEQIARSVIKHIRTNQAKILKTTTLTTLSQAKESIDTHISTREACWLIHRIDIQQSTLKIELNPQNLATWLSAHQEDITTSPLTFTTTFKAKRRCGVQTKLIIGSPPKEIDTTLLKNIAKAITYYDLIKKGKSYKEISTSENVPSKTIQKTIKLAFLSPKIIRQVMSGNQPRHLTSEYFKRNTIPEDWKEQQTTLKNPKEDPSRYRTETNA